MKKEKEVVDFDRFGQKLDERKKKIGGGEKMIFNEEYHLRGRPNWIVDLYYELDKFAMNLKPGVRKTYLESYIKYSYNGVLFTYFVIRKGETLRVWAKVPYQNLDSVPLFVRDYSDTMHRPGVIVFFDDQREFVANKSAMLSTAFGIIKKALQGIIGRKQRGTPLKPVTEVGPVVRPKPVVETKPVVVSKSPSINLTLGGDDYITLVFKVHKSNKKMLDDILEKIIYG